MRRFLILPLAGILLAAAATPVAAGANTSNTSNSGRTIQGEWYDGSTYGGIYFFEESGGDYGQVYEETGQWIECGGGQPEKGGYGFVGTRLFGIASSVSISMDSKLKAGSASGDFDVTIETVDECLGTYDAVYDTATIGVDVVGTGSLVMFRDSGSFKIPGDFNGHYRSRGKERVAAGQVDLGAFGFRNFGWAVMAEYQWSEHTNG